MNIHLAVVLWYFLEEIDKCFDIWEYLDTCLYHLCNLLIIAVSCNYLFDMWKCHLHITVIVHLFDVLAI